MRFVFDELEVPQPPYRMARLAMAEAPTNEPTKPLEPGEVEHLVDQIGKPDQQPGASEAEIQPFDLDAELAKIDQRIDTAQTAEEVRQLAEQGLSLTQKQRAIYEHQLQSARDYFDEALKEYGDSNPETTHAAEEVQKLQNELAKVDSFAKAVEEYYADIIKEKEAEEKTAQPAPTVPTTPEPKPEPEPEPSKVAAESVAPEPVPTEPVPAPEPSKPTLLEPQSEERGIPYYEELQAKAREDKKEAEVARLQGIIDRYKAAENPSAPEPTPSTPEPTAEERYEAAKDVLDSFRNKFTGIITSGTLKNPEYRKAQEEFKAAKAALHPKQPKPSVEPKASEPGKKEPRNPEPGPKGPIDMDDAMRVAQRMAGDLEQKELNNLKKRIKELEEKNAELERAQKEKEEPKPKIELNPDETVWSKAQQEEFKKAQEAALNMVAGYEAGKRETQKESPEQEVVPTSEASPEAKLESKVFDAVAEIERMGDTRTPGFWEQLAPTIEASMHDVASWWNGIRAKDAKDELAKRDGKIKSLEAKAKALAKKSWVGAMLSPIRYGLRLEWHRSQRDDIAGTQERFDGRKAKHENRRNDIFNIMATGMDGALTTYEERVKRLEKLGKELEKTMEALADQMRKIDVEAATTADQKLKDDLRARRGKLQSELQATALIREQYERARVRQSGYMAKVQRMKNDILRQAMPVDRPETTPGAPERLGQVKRAA